MEAKASEKATIADSDKEVSSSSKTNGIATIESAVAPAADLKAEKEPEEKKKEEEEQRKANEKKDAIELSENTKANTEQLEVQRLNQQKRRELINELLAATGGNIPTMFEEVNKELKGMMSADKPLVADEKLTFAEATTAFRIPNGEVSLTLNAKTTFFGMTQADQQLLYDQVGLFKGIVVDHRKENPLEQGYRDLLKDKRRKGDDERTKPTRAFYKKPRLAGFFESTYSLDETQRKAQEIGIFNFGFGLSASYSSWGLSASVKAGGSYGKEWQDERASQHKKLAITSNFFLPKVELSLDTLSACAADDFMTTVERVFTLPRDQQFDRLNDILRQFGQFIPTSLVIGGRLYSTEEKTIDSSTSMSNQLTKYSGQFQAAFSGWSLEGGVEAKTTHETSDKQASTEQHERQHRQLRAVGGEGAYVNNMNKWVESLAEYNAWGLVRFDDLVPSLQVLPADVQQQCHALLLETVTAPDMSIETLLEKNAHFLFYPGYLEPYGSQVRPRYFVLKAGSTDTNVLTVADANRFNGLEVVLKPYRGDVQQEWWRSPDGKLFARNDWGDTEKYALSVTKQGTSYELAITQEGYFPNQRWLLAGGLLKNEELGTYVEVDENGALTLSSREPSLTSLNVWQPLTNRQLQRKREVRTEKDPVHRQEKQVTALRNGEYIEKGQQIVSTQGTARLAFVHDQLVLSYGAGKEASPLWSRSMGPDKTGSVERLYLDGGRLYAVDSADNRHYLYGDESVPDKGRGNLLSLLECGNLELLNEDGQLAWETNTIIYSTIQSREGVLSLHHTDFAPSAGYPTVWLTVMPFVGADHQLWYQNSHNQLICKAQDGAMRKALTGNAQGGVSLEPEDYRRKDQQWILSVTNSGPITNKQTNRSLHPLAVGQVLSATIEAKSEWKLVAHRAHRSGIDNPMRIRTAEVIHEQNTERGYQHFNNHFEHYINLDVFSLKKKELRGIKLIKRDNQLAIRAIVVDGHEESLIGDEIPKRDSYDKSNLYFDQSPVYFPVGADRIGFRREAHSTYGLKAAAGATEYENQDRGHTIQMQYEDGISFFDMTSVIADDDEQVVGFGFTKLWENRLAPYLLTLKKQLPY